LLVRLWTEVDEQRTIIHIQRRQHHSKSKVPLVAISDEMDMTFLILIVAVVVVVLSSSIISSVDAFQFQFHDSTYTSKMNRSKSRRDVLIATVTSTITSPALISLLTFPQSAHATKDESMNYQAVWFDPQHPNGYRILYGDDQSATLLLKDTPQDNELILPVKVIKEEGKETKLLFDFSKLGLSNVEEGTLTRRKSDKVRIISFDNGSNEWINKKVRRH